MPDAPKKRPWFQIHLSTVVILMFVAAGLVGSNCRTIWEKNPVLQWLPIKDQSDVPNHEYGWPWKAYGWHPCLFRDGADGYAKRITWAAVVGDLILALFAVFVAITLNERRIRLDRRYRE